jgi:hypothetical protein
MQFGTIMQFRTIMEFRRCAMLTPARRERGVAMVWLSRGMREAGPHREELLIVQRRALLVWATGEAPALACLAAYFPFRTTAWWLVLLLAIPMFTTVAMMAALRPVDRAALPREATRPIRMTLWALGASGYVLALVLLFVPR